MTIQSFIEKAIEGGWKEILPSQIDYCHDGIVFRVGMDNDWKSLKHEQILLDPKAWEAVGKTEKWLVQMIQNPSPRNYEWFHKWHAMLDALAEGKTIEQYLETL